jgi:hypothetical protein
MAMCADNDPNVAGCKQGKYGRRALFCGILLLAVALRLPGFGAAPWLDEVYTLNWAEKSWDDVLRGSVQDTEHVTCLMPLVTKASLDLFRSPAVADEVVARLPHFLFGLSAIGLLFVFLKRRVGVAGALAGALFLATLPIHIKYSREARYYAFVILSGMLLVMVARRLLDRFSVTNLALFFAVVFLGTFNHLSFLSPLAMVCIALAGLLFCDFGVPPVRRVFRLMLLASLCVAGVAAAVLPSLVAGGPDAVRQALSSVHVPEPEARGAGDASDKVAERFQLNSTQWTKFVVGSYFGAVNRVETAGYLVLAGLGLVFLAFRDRRLLLLCAAPLACHVPFLFKLVKYPLYDRYFVVQIVGLAVLLAAGGQAIAGTPGLGRNALRTVALALVLVLFAVFRIGPLAQTMNMQTGGGAEYMRERTDYLAQQAEHGDVMVVQKEGRMFHPTPVIQYLLNGARAGTPDVAATLRWFSPPELPLLADQLQFAKKSNYWIVTEPLPRLRKEDRAALAAMGAQPQIVSQGVGLWAIGRDTVNMLHDGGFEGGAEGLTLPPKATLEDTGLARLGKRSLRFEAAVGDPFCPVWIHAVRGADGKKEDIRMPAGETYTLSFEARCGDGGYEMKPRGALVVSVGNAEMANVLCTLPLTAQWRRYEFPVIPGQHTTAGVVNPMVGFAAQTSGGSCGIALDNVQLERQYRATPFAAGVRRLGKTSE